MEDFIKKLSEEAKKISLEPRKRVSVRENLLLFMKENPLARAEPQKKVMPTFRKNIASPYISFLQKMSRVPLGAFAGILLLIVSGTVYGAEGSLPGDMLYSFKTGVNERVRSVLAFGAENDLQYHVDALDRRLSEGEQLAVAMRLGKQESAYLEKALDSERKKIADGIVKLETDGNYKTAVTLSSRAEVKLKAHQAVLSELALANTDTLNNNISTFLFSVEGHRDALHTIKNSAVEVLVRESQQPALESPTLAKLKSTEEQLAYADKKTQQQSKSTASMEDEPYPSVSSMRVMGFAVEASPEVTVESKIKAARDSYTRGNEFFQAGEYGKAYVLFDESSALLEEADLMKTLSEKFKLPIVIHTDTPSFEFKETSTTQVIPTLKATVTPKKIEIKTPTGNPLLEAKASTTVPQFSASSSSTSRESVSTSSTPLSP